MTRIALLGCGGFIGSHCLDSFLLNPHWILEGWDWTADKIGNHIGHPRFTFHRGDLYSDPQLENILSTCDVVISLAALCNPAQYNTRALDVIESNFIQARKIADICALHNKWLIQFSTSEVYGQTLEHWAQTGAPRADLYELDEDLSPMLLGPLTSQRWSYACAKQMLERYIYALHCEKNLTYTVIRPFNFLGPRMDYLPSRETEALPRVLACFTAAILDRQPLLLVDGGKNLRTFMAVEEAVDALRIMVENPGQARNHVFNLGNPANETSIRDLAHSMIQAAIRVTGDLTYAQLPLVDISALEFYGKGYADSDRRMPRIDKAQRLLGWQPKTALPAILERTLHFVFGHPRMAPGV